MLTRAIDSSDGLCVCVHNLSQLYTNVSIYIYIHLPIDRPIKWSGSSLFFFLSQIDWTYFYKKKRNLFSFKFWFLYRMIRTGGEALQHYSSVAVIIHFGFKELLFLLDLLCTLYTFYFGGTVRVCPPHPRAPITRLHHLRQRPLLFLTRKWREFLGTTTWPSVCIFGVYCPSVNNNKKNTVKYLVKLCIYEKMKWEGRRKVVNRLTREKMRKCCLC
jgi:hypothetical protein